MTYPVKIEFKEYPSGSYADWSAYLIKPPNVNLRVESENEGEAGVIVFDSAQVSFRYASGNPVYTAFSGDLTSVQRYLFRISFPKSDKSYVQRFEGMADFSTLKWNEFSNLVSFNVVDKLSALGTLFAAQTRSAVSVKDRVIAQLPSTTFIDFIFSGVATEFWIAAGYPDIYESFSSVVVNAGEVIKVPEKVSPTGTDYNFNYYVITESTLASHPSWPALTFNKVKVAPSHPNVSSYTYRFEDTAMDDIVCLSKEVYGVDINNISGGVLTSLKGVECIYALYNQAWPGATLVKKPSGFTFNLPLGYAVRMTDENPFGGTPLEAVKKLSDSMMCYIYVNREGNLVIQDKSAPGTSGTTRSIGTTKIIAQKKNYFWMHLADGATVTITSWLQDEFGAYLEGAATRTKQVPGSAFSIKPKNLLTKELLTSDPNDNTITLLNARASALADDVLAFYGSRRAAYDLVLNLDDNTIDWELVDNLIINSLNYFFTSLEFDPVERTVTLEPVEVTGHDYDLRQVVVTLSDDSATGGDLISGGAVTNSGVLTLSSLNKETPAGTVNGVNKTFALLKNPQSTFLFITRNGILQETNLDYVLTNNELVFIKAPRTGNVIKAYYV